MDRPTSSPPAVVTAAEWLWTPGAPAWALRRNGETLAAYWINGNAATTARAGPRRQTDPSATSARAGTTTPFASKSSRPTATPSSPTFRAGRERGRDPRPQSRRPDDPRRAWPLPGGPPRRDGGRGRLAAPPHRALRAGGADLRGQATCGRERRSRRRRRALARQRDRLDRGALAERVPEGQGPLIQSVPLH